MQSLPSHIGLIMDGNGRWAVKSGEPRHHGHRHGLTALKKVLAHAAAKPGIELITAFALSKDNFKRSKLEINALLLLLEQVLIQESVWFKQKSIKVEFIGERSVFSKTMQNLLHKFEEHTRSGQKLSLKVALNYSGKQELLTIMPQALKAHDPDSFLEQNLPAIDLLIRTSGEKRVSDFCLWQLAYSELYFTDCLWPDFSEAEFDAALSWYQARDRRFGE